MLSKRNILEKMVKMKQETQTRETLLKIAKLEFLEKGYAGASLRSICKKADVTTGALYFFFKDKEDLFGSLVKDPLDKLYGIMKQHYLDEIAETEKLVLENINIENDLDSSKMAIHFMYHYHDEFLLLLTKAQGSKYEKCFDDFVEISENHYRILADKISKSYHLPRIDDYTIHWCSHVQIFTFAHFITHGLPQIEAEAQIEVMVKFMVSGWFSIWEKK